MAQPADIVVKDVVWMLSGGPAMTVVEIQGTVACCEYFNGTGLLGRAWIYISLLTKTQPKAG